MIITPRPPMSTMGKVENGPKALTFCKGEVLTQLASSMMPSLMTNTQWLWVAIIIEISCHQWKSSNLDPPSGTKVSTSIFSLALCWISTTCLLPGTPLPIPLSHHQMISWQNDLVVLGGLTTGHLVSSSCYLLQCHKGKFTWQELDAKLTKARVGFAAIKITESIAQKLTTTSNW